MTIRLARARTLGALALAPLREAALREGFAMLDRLAEEWESGANRFDAPGEAFFALERAGRLAGVCGLNRDPYLVDGQVGRLRHLYVHPLERRQGVGRLLVAATLAEARRRFSRVRLRTERAEARRFYERLGFRPVPGPDATHEWLG